MAKVDNYLKGRILDLLNNGQTPGLTNRQMAEALGLGSDGKALWQLSGALDKLKEDGILKTALKSAQNPLNHEVEYSYRFYPVSNEAALEQAGIISAEREVQSKNALELFDPDRLAEIGRSKRYKADTVFAKVNLTDVFSFFRTGKK